MRSILVRALVVVLAIGGAGGALALPMLLLGHDAESPTRFAHSFDPLAPTAIGGKTSTVHPGRFLTMPAASSVVSRALNIPSVNAGR